MAMPQAGQDGCLVSGGGLVDLLGMAALLRCRTGGSATGLSATDAQDWPPVGDGSILSYLQQEKRDAGNEEGWSALPPQRLMASVT